MEYRVTFTAQTIFVDISLVNNGSFESKVRSVDDITDIFICKSIDTFCFQLHTAIHPPKIDANNEKNITNELYAEVWMT